MVDAVVGTWNYESAVNMEEYMDTLGVPDKLKELAKTSKPVVCISREGKTWTIKTTVGDKISEGVYPEDEEIDIISLMGKSVKATLRVDGSDIVESHKLNDMELTIRRKTDGDKLLSIMRTKDVEAVVTFSKA